MNMDFKKTIKTTVLTLILSAVLTSAYGYRGTVQLQNKTGQDLQVLTGQNFGTWNLNGQNLPYAGVNVCGTSMITSLPAMAMTQRTNSMSAGKYCGYTVLNHEGTLIGRIKVNGYIRGIQWGDWWSSNPSLYFSGINRAGGSLIDLLLA